MNRFVTGKHSLEEPAGGFLYKDVLLGSETIRVQIWDTKNFEDPTSGYIPTGYYENADGCIVVADAAMRKTYENISTSFSLRCNSSR